MEQKVKEFTTVREKADQTEDSHFNQTLLDSARERAEVMKNEVAEDFTGSQSKAAAGEACW